MALHRFINMIFLLFWKKHHGVIDYKSHSHLSRDPGAPVVEERSKTFSGVGVGVVTQLKSSLWGTVVMI